MDSSLALSCTTHIIHTISLGSYIPYRSFLFLFSNHVPGSPSTFSKVYQSRELPLRSFSLTEVSGSNDVWDFLDDLWILMRGVHINAFPSEAAA